MTSERVEPARRVDTTIAVPGDKSMSHRALMLGAIAAGRSYIGNCSPAQDVASTMRCLRSCDAWVREFSHGRVTVDGSGPGASLRTPGSVLDCGNSGTTMRLLAGLLAAHDVDAVLDGDHSLQQRPMRRVADPLRAMGADVETAAEGTPPLRVRGHRRLRPIEWTLPVASAQVKSAVLLAALSAEGESSIVEPHATRDHTERMLRMCGVDVRTAGTRVRITPGVPQPFGFRVPGDISSAAFFLALAAARPGWRVRCLGVGLNATRTGILDVLRAMGATIEVEEGEPAGGIEPVGDVEVRGAPLHGVVIDGALAVRCIDEIPVIGVLATQADGMTEVRGVGELRRKESDRIAGVAGGLRALGAECEATADGLAVSGPASLHAAALDSRGDHRLAMAWAVAGSLASPEDGGTIIEGAEAAAVSYPRFFEDLRGALTTPM
ncbi:MAG: 3-phosphoshikimate 1-carboxyvinyltransferase [Candidatus Dormibacteraeota bacterium]|nr:3-phosphoshikimate 1-carboxyvinyltransferase [Candidatus Dormibacteraeota bacterium]